MGGTWVLSGECAAELCSAWTAEAAVATWGALRFAFVVRKLWGAGFVNVGFGEFLDAIERGLQFGGVMLQVFVGCVGGDLYQFSDSHQDSGEGLGNHQAVPGVEGPGVVDG